jgi:hypothetical protein
MRRPNPAREATPTPPVSLEITEADLQAARELWRKHAPHRYVFSAINGVPCIC